MTVNVASMPVYRHGNDALDLDLVQRFGHPT